MKHCMYCDALMASDAIFCPKCGRKQNNINNNATNNVNNDINKDKYKDIHRSNSQLTTNQQILIESKVNNESKSIGVAYLLWWFFGWLGAHRFYLNIDGAIAMPIIWFLCWFIWYFIPIFGSFLLLAFLVWWVVDAFNIPRWIKQNKLNIKNKIINKINPNIRQQKKRQKQLYNKKQHQFDLKNNNKSEYNHIHHNNKKLGSISVFIIALLIIMGAALLYNVVE